jgi:hypothetical protein
MRNNREFIIYISRAIQIAACGCINSENTSGSGITLLLSNVNVEQGTEPAGTVLVGKDLQALEACEFDNASACCDSQGREKVE